MIEIKAKTGGAGSYTEVDIHLRGSAAEIGLEAAYILTQLPLQLIEKNRQAFAVMSKKMKEITEATHEKYMDNIRKEENKEGNNGQCN